MDINVKLSLITIGFGGLGGFAVFLYKRCNFFKFIKSESFTFIAICQAVKTDKHFIKINENMIDDTSLSNNWIKPYKHIHSPHKSSGMSFYNPYEDEKCFKWYKIDLCLYYFVKIAIKFKNKTILNANYSQINSRKSYEVEFAKNNKMLD